MKQEVLNLIFDNSYLDYSLNQASDDEIDVLRKKSKVELAQEYLAFLKEVNGFELNGMNFYGTEKQDELFVLGVLEQNNFWCTEIAELNDYFLIGDSDLDFYCYSSGKKRYLILSKGGLVVYNEFDLFDNFLEQIIRSVI